MKRATEKLVVELLPVIDDLERAIEHADNLTDSQSMQFVEGVSAVKNKLVGGLLGRELNPGAQPPFAPDTGRLEFGRGRWNSPLDSWSPL